MVFVLSVGPQDEHHHHHGEEAEEHTGRFELVTRLAGEKLGLVLSPVMKQGAVEPLSDGVLIPWADVAASAGLMVLVYSGLLHLAGVWFFRRRELALPQS